MTAIHSGCPALPADARQRLYEGDIFVLDPLPAALELVEVARAEIEEGFAPHDPLRAQYSMPVDEWVERFAPVKPRFIHHPRTSDLIASVLAQAGTSETDTYFDVPRLRGVTSDGYLTAGVGFAHHPHRDTWYSAPMCQLNWWMPLYPFVSSSSMAFHGYYFGRAVPNSSDEFNYYEWNATGRKNAASQVATDNRKQPTARSEIERLEPDVRVVCPVGSIIVFSASHLHSTVPNTSGVARFSIDFRTVSRADLETGTHPVNADSHPDGTSLRDFKRCLDREPLPASLVAQYETTPPPDDAVLVFRPPGVDDATV